MLSLYFFLYKCVWDCLCFILEEEKSNAIVEREKIYIFTFFRLLLIRGAAGAAQLSDFMMDDEHPVWLHDFIYLLDSRFGYVGYKNMFMKFDPPENSENSFPARLHYWDWNPGEKYFWFCIRTTTPSTMHPPFRSKYWIPFHPTPDPCCCSSSYLAEISLILKKK